MSNGRRLRRALVVLPDLPEGQTPAFLDAIARRNAASVSGRCECGAEVRITGPDSSGVLHGVFEHADGCPATDEAIARLARTESETDDR